MADNLTTPIPAGAILAADDVGGVLYPRTKVSFGADGAAADVTTQNPLPVTLPAGFATSAKQDAATAASTAAGPATSYVPVTLGSANLPGGACRAMVAETAGRVNLKQPDGTARANFPLVAGLNPIGALMIDAPTSGTAATGVWAIY